MSKNAYIVSSIKLDGMSGDIVLNDVAMPKNINEIKDWLEEYDYRTDDDQFAYECYLRAVLFHRHTLTYNCERLELDTTDEHQYAAGTHIVDLNDATYHDGCTTVTVRVTMPTIHVALLDTFESQLVYTDGEQHAVFENLLHSLPIKFNWM